MGHVRESFSDNSYFLENPRESKWMKNQNTFQEDEWVRLPKKWTKAKANFFCPTSNEIFNEIRSWAMAFGKFLFYLLAFYREILNNQKSLLRNIRDFHCQVFPVDSESTRPIGWRCEKTFRIFRDTLFSEKLSKW